MVTVVLLFNVPFIQLANAEPWRVVNSMNSPRYHHTATLLFNGGVLVAGGYDNSPNSLATAELFNFITEKWTKTGSMNDSRGDHDATRLKNGQVLVTGGFSNNSSSIYDYKILATAELFNPVTRRWQRTGSMTVPRANHTSTLLANGTVLVTGGDNDVGITNGAEVYTFSDKCWVTTSSLNVARTVHTATLLSNGKVLVVGGIDAYGNPLKSAELYDPNTKIWTYTGSLNSERFYHSATLLPDGKVLVVGGYGLPNRVISSTELYDPITETWTETATSLNDARGEQSATLLSNGQILIAGGYAIGNYGGALNSVESYQAAQGAWTQGDPLNFARGSHTSTLLPTGRVLITGGYDDFENTPLSSVEINGPSLFHAAKYQASK